MMRMRTIVVSVAALVLGAVSVTSIADARRGGGGHRGGHHHAGGHHHGGAHRHSGGQHRHVNRNANVNRNRNVNVAGRGVVRGWSARPYFGTVVGGVVLGTIITAAAVGAAPASPDPNVCWYWTDDSRVQGYWAYCKEP
jgi:hypothetical protein